jgi:hypothetical protein
MTLYKHIKQTKSEITEEFNEHDEIYLKEKNKKSALIIGGDSLAIIEKD